MQYIFFYKKVWFALPLITDSFFWLFFLSDFEYNLICDTHQFLNFSSLSIFSTSIIIYIQWTEMPLKYCIYILFKFSFTMSM